MKTNLKKLVAGASVLGLVAINTLTSVGANANPTFSAITLNGAGVADDVVTVTIPATLVANNGDKVVVSVKEGLTAVDLTGKISGLTDGTNNVGATNLANGVYAIDVTAVATPVTFNFTPGIAGNFTISVLGTAGVGSAVVYFGGANQVQVSAVVMPFLDFDIDSNAFTLGELQAGSYKKASLLVDLSTNANGGATVSVASNGLKGANTGKFIGFVGTGNGATTNNDATAAATNFYKYSVSNFNTDAATTKTAAETAVDASTDVMAATLSNIITTSGAPATIQKGFAIGAKRAALTEADNYSDTLTFTVTGTF